MIFLKNKLYFLYVQYKKVCHIKSYVFCVIFFHEFMIESISDIRMDGYVYVFTSVFLRDYIVKCLIKTYCIDVNLHYNN